MARKILIVEDIPMNRRLIGDILKYHGYEILEAENGEDGIRMAREQNPDLVIMDLQMPVKNGYDAIKILKNDPGTIARTGNLDAKNFRILVRRTITYNDFHVLNIQDTVSVFPVHAIIDLRQQVIELRNAEIELKEEMRRRSWQNELILSAAGEGICGLDLQGRVIFINPAGAQMCGYEVEDIIGQSLHDLVHHTKPDRTPYPHEECPHYRTLVFGEPSALGDEVFWKKDGTSFPVGYTSTPILEERTIKGAVIVFRDITKRKRVEEKLRQSDEFK